MKHVTNQTIRRHRDGSIDTAYYLQRGRIARSRAAYITVYRLRRAAHSLAAQLSAKVSMSLMWRPSRCPASTT